MNTELSRFLVLFDHLIGYTEAWLDRLDPAKLEWMPIENPSMRFGDRVGRITVKGLLWGMYAHRAFHVGNIDIYLRQSDVITPEFFEFTPLQMA